VHSNLLFETKRFPVPDTLPNPNSGIKQVKFTHLITKKMQVMANRIAYSLRNAACTCGNSRGSQYIQVTVPMTFRNAFFVCPVRSRGWK